MEQRIHKCPVCGELTSKVHDYRTQLVVDISSFGLYTILHLRKRRHVCTLCGKQFYEHIDFLPRYHRSTNRLFAHVLKLFRESRPIKSIAAESNISETTAARIFDHVNYSPSKLPEVLSIDEFRGNSGGEKFQCILTDPKNRKIFDILQSRTQEELAVYFSKFDNRKDVKCVVMDMYSSYRAIAKTLFPKAVIIADRFHYVRLVTWAFERIRIEEQKKFHKHRRLHFKHSKKLLLMDPIRLNDDQACQVEVMLQSSERLRHAYFVKNEFSKFMNCRNSSDARKELGRWNMCASNYGLPEFEKVAKTFVNWSREILNSFDYPYTNGFTEGCNNKIKVIKRVAYGMRNFSRFRKRIMHSMSL